MDPASRQADCRDKGNIIFDEPALGSAGPALVRRLAARLADRAVRRPNTAFIDAKLARNRRLYDHARSVGGTRYCIGSIPFDHADWLAQYGNQWPAFQALKQQFDPDGILAPGPGIFSP